MKQYVVTHNSRIAQILAYHVQGPEFDLPASWMMTMMIMTAGS